MSCPSQERLSIYVDGELALGEARTLESHLVQCRRCRASVLARQRRPCSRCDSSVRASPSASSPST
ncbi:MAG TPA: hypothetical protein ENO23_00025 [Alphaproteobacteria bacterium]|nr:hypothetical protein [Alphaproteobacteria bacterium]